MPTLKTTASFSRFPVLQDGERAALRLLLKEAFDGAALQDGSEAAHDLFMEAAIGVEDFIRDRNPGLPRDEAERGLTGQAGGPPVTVDDILRRAVDTVKQAFARAAGKEDFLLLLQRGGAAVMTTPSVYVKTDPGALHPANDTPGVLYDPKFQDRLRMLVEGLRDLGVYTDDLIVHAGRTSPDMMRRKPYILVEIPRLGRQIAVCDQVGEITFVSRHMIAPATWESLGKDDLKRLPGVEAVRFTSRESWMGRIGSLVLDGQAGRAIKIDVAQTAARPGRHKPFPLGEAFILHHARLHLETHGSLPTPGSGPVDGMAGETWAGWHMALYQGLRGLPGGSSLTRLFIQHGLKAEKPPLTEAFILHHARLHLETHGRLPTRLSGPVDGMEGETWKNWDSYLRQGLRGLPGGSSLTRLFIQHDLKADKPFLTEAFILHHARLHLETHGRLPTRLSGPVDGMEGETWGGWYMALYQGLRGLPGGSSLSQLFKDNGLKARRAASPAP